MAEVSIVTDGTAQFLSQRAVHDLNIVVVPVQLSWGQEHYLLGRDISHEAVLSRVLATRELPQIIPPSTQDFLAVYQDLSQRHHDVVSIHSANRVNNAYQHAHEAKRHVMGRCNIEVIDSESFSLGVGLVAEKAAQKAVTGASFDDIVRYVRYTMTRLYSIFVVGNLSLLSEHLIMQQAHAILGSLLDFKAIISLEDGALMVVEKAQTTAQAVDKMAEFAAEFEDLEEIVLTSHTTHLTEASRLLQDRLALDLNLNTFPIMPLGAMTLLTFGDDVMGLYILEAESEEENALSA